MPNYFNLTLDTIGPSNPSIALEGGATYATQQLVTATISTTDGSTTGYQVKLWGDVDTAYDSNVQASEGASAWISWTESKQVKLSAAEGTKTVYLKIRDDVNNESSQASDTIILDTTLPVVTITGPDVTKISKQSGKNVASFSFQVDTSFNEYKVKVVSASSAVHTDGVLIATTNGSTNMSGTGTWTSSSVINSTINGTDLEVASSGDGSKIIKVFVKDTDTGQWSV